MKTKIICLVFVIVITVLISVEASKMARRRSANRLFREKAMLYNFLNFTHRILRKRNASDHTTCNWLTYFQKDLRSAYAVGTIFLRIMAQYNSNNATKLTEEENIAIQDAFKTLVKDYHNHDSFALWMGDDQGGTITAAIYKFVGGNPIDVLGPPNNPKDCMSEIIYPTEKPDDV